MTLKSRRHLAPLADAPLIIPFAFPANAATPIALPAGSIAQNPDSYACILTNVDSSVANAANVTSVTVTGGSGSHAALFTTGGGGQFDQESVHVWKPRVGDNSVSITLAGAGLLGTVKGVIIYIPSLGQHLDADSPTQRSSNTGLGTSSITLTASTFIAGDTTISWGFQKTGNIAGVTPAASIPSLSGTGSNQPFHGYLNLESVAMSWNKANATATLTRGTPAGTGPGDNISLTVIVFPGH